jgi:2-dehydro-3-deoxygluconokinase
VSGIDVLAIGEPMVEFNQTRPGSPEYLQGFGGDTSNVAIAAARSGARAAYVTRVGDDAFGRLLLDLWKREGVDTRGVAVDAEAPTGAYFVTHEAGGHSFTYLRTGSAASRMRPAELPLDLVRAARFAHASGISLAISPPAADTVLAAFEAARGAGRAVSFDANLRLRLWPLARAKALIREAAAGADYFMPSADDARLLSGREEADAILDWALATGARNVLLKLGAQGAMASDGARRERFPGFAVRAVDATGAGDCFCGAALARLAAGDSLWDAARYANAAAALSTTGFGAVGPLPRPEAVLRLLGGGGAPPGGG